MLHANASFASVRALVRLNTVELLKRAALERKKSDGAYRALYPLAPLGFALEHRSLHSSVTFIIEPFFMFQHRKKN